MANLKDKLPVNPIAECFNPNHPLNLLLRQQGLKIVVDYYPTLAQHPQAGQYGKTLCFLPAKGDRKPVGIKINNEKYAAIVLDGQVERTPTPENADKEILVTNPQAFIHLLEQALNPTKNDVVIKGIAATNDIPTNQIVPDIEKYPIEIAEIQHALGVRAIDLGRIVLKKSEVIKVNNNGELYVFRKQNNGDSGSEVALACRVFSSQTR